MLRKKIEKISNEGLEICFLGSILYTFISDIEIGLNNIQDTLEMILIATSNFD